MASDLNEAGRWCDFCQQHHTSVSCYHPAKAKFDQLERELAAAKAATANAEPVAWRYTPSFRDGSAEWEYSKVDRGEDWEPLYAAPPATDADRRDAERYRWLRERATGYHNSENDYADPPVLVYDGKPNEEWGNASIDAAIDAARANDRIEP